MHLLCTLQSLLRLKEPAVLLRCRKEDINVVENVLGSAVEEYARKANVHEPEVIIDRVHLPGPPSSHHAHGPSWYVHTIFHQARQSILFLLS